MPIRRSLHLSQMMIFSITIGALFEDCVSVFLKIFVINVNEYN